LRIKLDENLPRSLAAALSADGHDVDTAVGEGLGGRPDGSVLRAAAEASRLLVTNDLDFGLLDRQSLHGHAGVLLLRLADAPTPAVVARVVEVIRASPFNTWDGQLAVVTRKRVRLRRKTVN